MTTNNALVVTAERGVPFVDTVRVVNAPVADVYRAHIDPALVAQWMGPRGLTTEILDRDARIGGTWAFTQAGPDGADGAVHGVRGVFHDPVPDRSIVQTFEYDGVPGHVSLDRIVLEDLGGRTRITGHSVFQSQEDRDGMVASGMDAGVREGTSAWRNSSARVPNLRRLPAFPPNTRHPQRVPRARGPVPSAD
ncbi:SRPBCC domain-containing protein [Arthrobacter livingstonensis]|uniref:SRPBCC domain-containing protein n=1 Tax=Arthrobacter livingstonensis TaxID=670078 RepID=UPI001FEB085C|nr:SRPBCC domain-containing protein [Arthrobacter livingstonensis]